MFGLELIMGTLLEILKRTNFNHSDQILLAVKFLDFLLL